MSIQYNNVSGLDQLLKRSHIKDLPEELVWDLVRIIKKEGYKCCNIAKTTVSTKGGNYLGILHEVDIKGTTVEGHKKETHLFIKQAVTIKKIRVLSVDNIYSKEVFFYTDLVKIFDQLQNEANIPEEERFNTPKGYDESSKNAIILENLRKRGYKTFQRAEGLKLKYAELSIEQLAKFHALSFAMQQRMPEYYKMKIEVQKYPFIFNEDWHCFIANIWNKVIDAVESDVKEKVKNLLPKMHNDYQSYLTDNSPVSVLCHGDYKPQNLMMKEINNETVKLIPLDYQLMYHGCPVIDFMFYIFCSTDQKFRKDHLEHLKDLYHDSLRVFLRNFGMDVESIFSRELFENMYREKLLYGLMTGLYMAFFYFVPENDVPDMQNRTLAEITINPDYGFGNRVRGLVDDFIQWGYL